MIRLNFTKTWSFSRNGTITESEKKVYSFNLLLLSTLLLYSANPSMGQEISMKWKELDSAEKKILAPLQNKWNNFSPAKKNRLTKGAKKMEHYEPGATKNR